MSITSLTERYFEEKDSLHRALEVWEERLRAQARRIDTSAIVSGRVKSYRSLLGKAYRKAGTVRTWEKFGDLVALKAVFPTTRGVEAFSAWLDEQSQWHPVLDEKPGAPQELKYQAKQFDLHADDVTDSRGDAVKIEVQVRTAASDAWYVVDHRLQYKGVVTLTSELQRKLYRLIVLTELFDEEVEAVMQRQTTMPEYAVARFYEILLHSSETLFGDHTRTSRPEGLLELLLTSYPDSKLETLATDIVSFVDQYRDQLTAVFPQHHHGSESYVEARDWIYYEPEALLIAERASRKPSLLRSKIAGSDFEYVIEPMLSVFGDLTSR